MATGFTPDNEQFLRDAIAAGQYPSRVDALNDAVRLLREEEETLAALREGLESIDRGEGVLLSEADAILREKHNIPPTSNSSRQDA